MIVLTMAESLTQWHLAARLKKSVHTVRCLTTCAQSAMEIEAGSDKQTLE
jgi:hypothetical protein